MPNRFRCLAPHALAVLFAAALAPAAPAHASDLQLNEFLAGPARDWDGSGAVSTRDDEWVEVKNTTAAPLDLAGWILTDGDSLPRYAFTGTLEAGGHLLVTGKMSFDWEKANSQPAFGLSLGNSGDAVILWHIEGADTVVVDAYTYKGHEAAADRSVGRTDDTGAWSLFDGLDPYTGTTLPSGTGCNPTPAAANTCGTTPTHRDSWGALKRLYHDAAPAQLHRLQ